MNKLEQRIFEEFDRFEKFSQYISKDQASVIAARVALELAEKAFKAGDKYATDIYWTASGYGFESFKKEVLGDSSIN